jgi:hypothetical protein
MKAARLPPGEHRFHPSPPLAGGFVAHLWLIAGRSLRAVGRAYAELGEVAAQLAEAVDREDRASGLLPAAVRKRRKAA